MRINGEPYTVVGVLAPGIGDRFDFELAAPLAFRPEQINHDYHWLLAMGRLKPGVTLQQARADMDAVTAHIAAAYPNSNKGWGASVEPLQNDFLPRERIRNLWLLLGAVGFVLVIACVNIANLLLAKGAARLREIAIRSSVGANRGQIFYQFLTESLVLALDRRSGLGIGLGVGLLRAILSIVPEGILPSEANFQLDIHVLVVALAATTLAGVLFGCAPAWYASRVDPGESLKEGGRVRARALAATNCGEGSSPGNSRWRCRCWPGAGLAIHSFWNLTRVDLGVRTDHVLIFGLHQPQGRFKNPDEMNTYNQQMLSTAAVRTGSVECRNRDRNTAARGRAMACLSPWSAARTYADPSQRPGTGFPIGLARIITKRLA